MYRSRARAVEPSLGKHRNLFPFPAKTRRGIGRPVAVLAMVLLPLLIGGGRSPRPSRTVGCPNSRRAKPLQIHSPNSSLRLRSGSACRSSGSMPS